MQRLVKFEVMGQEYPLHTDAPEEDVREILQLVKSQLEKSAPVGTHLLPTNKLAILASLNMAAQYVGLKREYQEYRRQVEERLGRLAEQVERSLE